jgi:hypothetical protein
MKSIYIALLLYFVAFDTESKDKESLGKPVFEFRSENNIDPEHERKDRLKRTQFNKEDVNLKWASESEAEIVNRITGYTSEYSLHNVLCKTTMCKITIKTFKDNEVGRLSALMNISLLAFSSEHFYDYQSRSIHNKETGELDIYFYPAEEESD